MGKRIHFLLGLHCHQPVGNFDHVFEEAVRKSYRPFLEVLQRHPALHVTLHYTGVLLEWLQEHDPSLLDLIASLARSGQVEMMTGGFYEPVLPVIPDRDKVGQIRMLTDFLRARFGAEARGFWLAERVWEPHLPRFLKQAGVEFLTVDDSHFKAAGLEGEALTGRYVTEEMGSTVEVFPILEKLRYLIPFREPQETIDFLGTLADEGGRRCAVIHDDGEKFGIWPETYGWVFERGWLERFFQALEDNAAWIHTCTFSEYRALSRPLGRVYLPAASYTEMMEWVLPAGTIPRLEAAQNFLKQNQKWDDFGPFLKGGFWRNFQVKYDESNNMHKKMLLVSEKVARLAAAGAAEAGEAERELWMGQCNCPYWHGVFGGLYLNHLRFANYRHLIRAETLADRALRGRESYLEAGTRDFDADGVEEILVESGLLSAGIDPARGGSLFELDDRLRSVNLGDTMTRRFEAYHVKLSQAASGAGGDGVASIHDRVQSKEEGLADRLKTDFYRRVSALDHLLPPDTALGPFSDCRFTESGDFLKGAYDARVEKGPGGRGLDLVMRRDGTFWDDGRPRPFRVEKRFHFEEKSQEIGFHYVLKNTGDGPLPFVFGVEFNFGLLAGDAPDRYWEFAGRRRENSVFRSVFDEKAQAQVALVDEWLNLRIRFDFDREADLWAFPIETVSQSEGGFERVYQNTVVFPHWTMSLEPGAEERRGFRLCLGSVR